jgi:hypothetical protein
MSETVIGGRSGLELVSGKPSLPSWILGYQAINQEVSERELRILPDDTEYARKLYVADDRSLALRCSIVLAGSDRNSIHRPEVCLPGQGWAIENRFIREVTLADGSNLDTMVLMVSREEEAEPGKKVKIFGYYVYWFLGQDVATASHFTRVFLTSWDPIVRGVNHRWAYVSVDTTIAVGSAPDSETREAALAKLGAFIGDLVPNIWKPDVIQSEQ